jgi:hypothetical protein
MNRLTLASLLLLGACQDYTISGDPILAGNGDVPDLAPPVGHDVVRLARSTRSDILWVLDNSGSMSEEQDNLATNLNAFYDRLVEFDSDFHIGVITTDADSQSTDGVLLNVAGYNYLTPEVPYADELFRMMVRVGTGGSGDEKGIQTTFSALAQPTPFLQDANQGFLRDDAALHVIVVSDEEDSSTLTTTELATFMLAMKPNPDTVVTFNSIVGPTPDGCSNADTSASPGARYSVTTMRVGGIERSICEPDWVPVLDELGLQAAGLRREYYLSRLPIPETVKVRIDDPDGSAEGVLVTAVDEVEAACAGATGRCFGFEYDVFKNAVVVLGYDGDGGARVRITYTLRSGGTVEEAPAAP